MQKADRIDLRVAELQKTVDDIKKFVLKFGWTVLAKERTGLFPQLSYTVGLAAKGLPELILVGLEPVSARSALNRVAERLLAGTPLVDGEGLAEITPNFTVVPKKLSSTVAQRYMQFAHLFAADRSWTAYQVVWPDPSGQFPWDARYDTRWLRTQPMLESEESSPPAPERH